MVQKDIDDTQGRRRECVRLDEYISSKIDCTAMYPCLLAQK